MINLKKKLVAKVRIVLDSSFGYIFMYVLWLAHSSLVNNISYNFLTNTNQFVICHQPLAIKNEVADICRNFDELQQKLSYEILLCSEMGK